MHGRMVVEHLPDRAAVIERAGADMHFGVQLPGALDAAGLLDVQRSSAAG